MYFVPVDSNGESSSIRRGATYNSDEFHRRDIGQHAKRPTQHFVDHESPVPTRHELSRAVRK